MVRIHGQAEYAGWAGTYETLAFTTEALATNATDEDLAKLAARLSPLLSDWEAIDADGHGLRRAAIRADALVRMADSALDQATYRFAGEVLKAASGDATSELYRKYFPEPHEEVIALGLDSELPVVALIVQRLATEEDAPEALKAHLDGLRAALQQGNGALALRSDSWADLGRHTARMEAWTETAHSAKRSTLASLQRLAEARKLPAWWVESFFR